MKLNRLHFETKSPSCPGLTLWKRLPMPTWELYKKKGAPTISFGDINNDGKIELLFSQWKGPYEAPLLLCLRAVSLDGDILWQVGKPQEVTATWTDNAFVVVYDIDNDGKNEILCSSLLRPGVFILNGETGRVKNKIESPAGSLRGTIVICNFSGNEKAQDFYIKDEYRRLWAYNHQLELLWEYSGNTGQTPFPYDIDGDGKDELMTTNDMLDEDGEVLWSVETKDHSDGLIIANMGGEVKIGSVNGNEGFYLISAKGEVLKHHQDMGHLQTIALANFCPDIAGPEIYIQEKHNFQDAKFHPRSYLLNSDGEFHAKWTIEHPCDTGDDKIVNWSGDGEELLLAPRSGLYDGQGQLAIEFPKEHRDKKTNGWAIDFCGDAREEIVLWDPHYIYIYTQDRPREAKEIYRPLKRSFSFYGAKVSIPPERVEMS